MGEVVRWRLSHRFGCGLPLANRHYNRQKPESPQFVPPGRCVVMVAGEGPKAVWVSSWPKYARHAWCGAWVNTLFRNEGAGLSSELIIEAERVTRWKWGNPPEPHGFITFVDAEKVKGKRDPGYCYLMAGWKLVGKTQSGLLTFQRLPIEAPEAAPPLGEETMFASQKGGV